MAGRINRIRQGYFDAAPQVARYLPPPGPDTPPAIAAQAGGVQPVVVSVPDDPRDAGTAVTRELAVSAAVGVITGRRGAGRALRAASSDLAGCRAPSGTMPAR